MRLSLREAGPLSHRLLPFFFFFFFFFFSFSSVALHLLHGHGRSFNLIGAGSSRVCLLTCPHSLTHSDPSSTLSVSLPLARDIQTLGPRLASHNFGSAIFNCPSCPGRRLASAQFSAISFPSTLRLLTFTSCRQPSSWSAPHPSSPMPRPSFTSPPTARYCTGPTRNLPIAPGAWPTI